MDIEMEVRKITESYCLLKGIPIRRKFSDAELEQATDRVREAIALQKPLKVEKA